MTKARDLADFKLTNISDDGTGGTKVEWYYSRKR